MSQAKFIDARGLSCPEPILLVQQVLAGGGTDFTVAVSAPVARDNVSEFLQRKGYQTKVEATGDGWQIEVSGK